MKKYYMEKMISRLTEEERELLQAIYQPQIVTIPPCDVSNSLSVTPEGEIRIYGAMGKEHPTDLGTMVYLSSVDCGMTWKRHLVKKKNVLGSAGFNPSTGRYISVYPNEFRKDLLYSISKEGTWAIINDEGFDSTNHRYALISEKELHVMKKPVFIENCNRWIIPGEYADEVHHKYISISYSDDDGESWTTNILENSAPAFNVDGFHKGTRWQQYSCEPSIVETNPGELLMIVRTSQNYHYMYKSYDCGTTWTEPEPTVFHGTITMPVLYKLEDERILFFWCNTQPLPELDHELTRPCLSWEEKNGIWEDVFTNRDANHLAISEDSGKSFPVMRELFLNIIRNYADFRSVGGHDANDKSVHQAEMLELPFNKLLVCFGQNEAARKAVILDIDWLYEQNRKEDFRKGLCNVSTHMYVKSNLGGYRGFSGHCAYNRVPGALLVPDPDENFEEVLQICRIEDERLVYKKQGMVWNFPSSFCGTVNIKLRVLNSGVSVCLCDHWYNACDETVRSEAPISFDFTKEMGKSGQWSLLSIVYDLGNGKAIIRVDSQEIQVQNVTKKLPLGLSYLHIQTLAEEQDMEGTLIKSLEQFV